jgi:hypothetical protein
MTVGTAILDKKLEEVFISTLQSGFCLKQTRKNKKRTGEKKEIETISLGLKLQRDKTSIRGVGNTTTTKKTDQNQSELEQKFGCLLLLFSTH